MIDNKAVKIREYNMDLERVLLIFMVIVLHYNNRGMGGALNYAMDGAAKEFFIRMAESLCICAVDAFMILGGYFAANRRGSVYKKAVALLGACSFYRTIAYLIHAFFVIHEFSIKTLVGNILPLNWYVCLFVTTMILAPYIDKLVDNLEETDFDKLMLATTVLFVVLPTFVGVGGSIVGVDFSGLSTISVNGDIEGFTIVAFLYCYILGSYLKRRNKLFVSIPKFLFAVVYVVCALLATVISYRAEAVWSYSGLLTVMEALTITCFFERCSIKNGRVGELLSKVGGCGLGVFVWHTSPLMLYGFWVHFGIDGISSGSIGFLIINLFISCIAMYAVSGIWVLTCRCLLSAIKKHRRR